MVQAPAPASPQPDCVDLLQFLLAQADLPPDTRERTHLDIPGETMAHPLKGLEFVRIHDLPRGEIRQLNGRVFEINHDTLKLLRLMPSHVWERAADAAANFTEALVIVARMAMTLDKALRDFFEREDTRGELPPLDA
jgi:hypothetical protein